MASFQFSQHGQLSVLTAWPAFSCLSVVSFQLPQYGQLSVATEWPTFSCHRMAKLATTEQTITQRLTIEFLHRSDVIVVQFKVALVAPVERGHERRAGIRVREAQRVAELVGCYLEQVHACKKTGRELRRRRQNGERIQREV